MGFMSVFDKAKEFVATTKGKVLIVAGTVSMTMVQYASAATLNESIGPILESVTELFVPLLALIIAAVPLIVAISVIGFILGILSAILAKLHV
jgi:phosphotransferase system  glucose/maltose/N-acetylglucosamine-specific IIC component